MGSKRITDEDLQRLADAVTAVLPGRGLYFHTLTSHRTGVIGPFAKLADAVKANKIIARLGAINIKVHKDGDEWNTYFRMES